MINGSLRPDPPAMAQNDALRKGQANARSLVLLRAVQPLENAEELVGVGHVEARAVVAHKVDVARAG